MLSAAREGEDGRLHDFYAHVLCLRGVNAVAAGGVDGGGGFGTANGWTIIHTI